MRNPRFSPILNNMQLTDLSGAELIRFRVDASSLEGEMTLELRHLCRARLEAHPSDVVLELPHVRFVDSQSIGTLLWLVQTLKKTGHRLSIQGATAELRQLMRAMLLDQYIELTKN